MQHKTNPVQRFHSIADQVYVQEVRVHVNQQKCQGHNRCVVLAPDLFEVDVLGTASAKGTGEVPEDREEAAQLAVDNCPEYAITLTEPA